MSALFAFDDGMNARFRAAVDAHKAHAAREWPREAGGLVLEDGSYAACRNIADDPLVEFELDPDEVHAVSGQAYAAVLHSHASVKDPETGRDQPPLDCPSGVDMQGQLDTGVPWGISLCLSTGATDPFWWGRGVPRPPLVGRVFRHGIDDCYSLIQDWHRDVAGIDLPDFVRDVEWWELRPGEPQADLYMDGFARAGFAPADPERVSRGLLLPGDCFICKIRSPVLNHAGIYIGDGLILHHLMDCPSKRDPASLWRPKLNFIVRHKDLPEDWVP